MTTTISIPNPDAFDKFAINFAKHSKLKATHVRSVIAKTQGFQTIDSYKKSLENTNTANMPLSDIVEQIERANQIVESANNYATNDMDELIKLMPIFSDDYAENLGLTPDDEQLLLINATCVGALNNYLASKGQSITIECKHINNDTMGNDHFLNTIAVSFDGNDFIIKATTVLSHDYSGYALERQEPIKATLNGESVKDVFFDDFDELIMLTCPEFDHEFFWSNPVAHDLLAKANQVLATNLPALQSLKGIEGF